MELRPSFHSDFVYSVWTNFLSLAFYPCVQWFLDNSKSVVEKWITRQPTWHQSPIFPQRSERFSTCSIAMEVERSMPRSLILRWNRLISLCPMMKFTRFSPPWIKTVRWVHATLPTYTIRRTIPTDLTLWAMHYHRLRMKAGSKCPRFLLLPTNLSTELLTHIHANLYPPTRPPTHLHLKYLPVRIHPCRLPTNTANYVSTYAWVTVQITPPNCVSQVTEKSISKNFWIWWRTQSASWKISVSAFLMKWRLVGSRRSWFAGGENEVTT